VDGVDLVSGISRVVTLAMEPRMGDSLPWLDSNDKDDRLLANVVEVMRTQPRSPVWLVTRDINLQNKAEFANVPFVEPPRSNLIYRVKLSAPDSQSPLPGFICVFGSLLFTEANPLRG
jgi:predicted ribonuclease YlaK